MLSDSKEKLKQSLRSLFEDISEAEIGPDRTTYGFSHRLEEIFNSLVDLESKIVNEFQDFEELEVLSDYTTMNHSRGDSGMAQLIKSRIKKVAIYTETDLEKNKSTTHETHKTDVLRKDSSNPQQQTTSDETIKTFSKENKRLEKLENDIQEKKLESTRREAVTETKMYGGFIEVITSLRNELKRRDENSKEISDIKTQIRKLDEKFNSFTNSSPEKSTQNREDKWYDEIVQKNKGTIYGPIHVQKAKATFAKIKNLREEISEIERELGKLADSLSKDFIYQDFQRKKQELRKHLDLLADQWSQSS